MIRIQFYIRVTISVPEKSYGSSYLLILQLVHFIIGIIQAQSEPMNAQDQPVEAAGTQFIIPHSPVTGVSSTRLGGWGWHRYPQ